MRKVNGNTIPPGMTLTKKETELLEKAPSKLTKEEKYERSALQSRISYQRLKMGIRCRRFASRTVEERKAPEPRKESDLTVTPAVSAIGPATTTIGVPVRQKKPSFFANTWKQAKDIFRQFGIIRIKPETHTALELNKIDGSYLLVSGPRKIWIKQASYHDVVQALEVAGFKNYKILRMLAVQS